MEKPPFNKLNPISFDQVQIIDAFWSKRQKINRKVSIHFQYQKFEENHHIDNFRVASGLKKGITRGLFYLDSDLYKWLEGASYILHQYDDLVLEEKVNEIVDLIAESQMQDGYINTYYSTKFPGRKLTFIHITHELYCAGHLFQAAIAHYNATRSKKLLNIAIKFADLLVKRFLGGKIKGAPGHEEIELALIALYRITKNTKYLELVQDFINRRGNIKNFGSYALYAYLDCVRVLKKAKTIEQEYDKLHSIIEKEKEGPPEYAVKLTLKDVLILFRENYNGNTYQLNVPVRKAWRPVGHAVRAMYLYCGMADLYSEAGDKSLLKALEKIWLKLVKARIYITGGVGSVKAIEGFGRDFKLKPKDSYSETCAAIGNMMWNWRMLQITGKAKYADLIERLLYNAMLVGQSIDGKKYTYSNPLVSYGKNERQEWFICACCPPNVARTISSIGKYVYSTSEKGIWIHQYVGNRTSIRLTSDKIITLIQESHFPWRGKVKIKLEMKNNQKFKLFFRIPKWCNETELKINQEKYQDYLTPGKYVEIIRNWTNDDIIDLNFKMELRLEKSDQRIKANHGRVAISCGPLIYCIEQRDNKNINIFKSRISQNTDLKITYKPEFLGGINIIEGNLVNGQKFTAIPYYTWGNRGPNNMQIWNLIEK